jgi:formate dehydrogenase maturation protein FdhE
LSVILKISSDNGLSSAQTSIEAWRELTMPIDTSIENKEKYWNEMVQKLFEEFNTRMEENINQYLNMYVKNNNTVHEY